MNIRYAGTEYTNGAEITEENKIKQYREQKKAN